MIIIFIIIGKNGYKTFKEEFVGFGNLLKVQRKRKKQERLDYEVWASENTVAPQ